MLSNKLTNYNPIRSKTPCLKTESRREYSAILSIYPKV